MINQKDVAKRGGEADRLTLAPGVTLELAWIPAGEFVMGSDQAKDPAAYDNETPEIGPVASPRTSFYNWPAVFAPSMSS